MVIDDEPIDRNPSPVTTSTADAHETWIRLAREHAPPSEPVGEPATARREPPGATPARPSPASLNTLRSPSPARRPGGGRGLLPGRRRRLRAPARRRHVQPGPSGFDTIVPKGLPPLAWTDPWITTHIVIPFGTSTRLTETPSVGDPRCHLNSCTGSTRAAPEVGCLSATPELCCPPARIGERLSARPEIQVTIDRSRRLGAGAARDHSSATEPRASPSAGVDLGADAVLTARERPPAPPFCTTRGPVPGSHRSPPRHNQYRNA